MASFFIYRQQQQQQQRQRRPWRLLCDTTVRQASVGVNAIGYLCPGPNKILVENVLNYLIWILTKIRLN